MFNTFESVMFSLATIEGTGLKILTPEQMLQRLSIALAQVKAVSRSGNLLNETRQPIYSLHRVKKS